MKTRQAALLVAALHTMTGHASDVNLRCSVKFTPNVLEDNFLGMVADIRLLAGEENDMLMVGKTNDISPYENTFVLTGFSASEEGELTGGMGLFLAKVSSREKNIVLKDTKFNLSTLKGQGIFVNENSQAKFFLDCSLL